MYELSLPQIIGSDLTLECEFVDLKLVHYFFFGRNYPFVDNIRKLNVI